MKKIILFLFLALPLSGLAQNLYLKINTNDTQYLQYAGVWKNSNNDNVYRKVYILTVNAREPSFICENKNVYSQTKPIDALANYTTAKSFQEVAPLWASMDYEQIEEWLNQYQNVYIIQVLPSGTEIEVSKVRFVSASPILRK
jgi:hypothetical protein